jgi:DNA invertase Pin-like site-specific DNA recombinase
MKEPKRAVPQPSPEPGPPDSARCVVYARVSTDSQAAADRVSLAEQERQCREFAAKRDWQVAYVWTDAGVSGRDEERLERLAHWCEQHPRRDAQGGRIVVLNASRWGRFPHSPDASSFFKHWLRRCGWLVEFVQHPSTGNRTTDGVVAVVHDAQAAAESEEKAYRSTMGGRGGASHGHSLGRPPFGFDRLATHATSGKTRKLDPYERSAAGEHVTLVVNPTQARVVRRMFALALRGASYEQIADRLNREGAPGPFTRYVTNWDEGHTPQWNAANVRIILRNEIYTGTKIYGRKGPADAVTKCHPRTPPETWVVKEGAVEALVTRKQWERVQALYRNRKPLPRPHVVNYLLSGLVKCVKHDRALTGGGGTRPGAKDPLRDVHYRCPDCRPRLTLNKRKLEAQIVGLVTGHVRAVVNSRHFDRTLDELLAAQRRRSQGREAPAERARALLRLRQERDRLVQAVAEGVLKREEAGPLLTRVREQLTRLEEERDQGRFADRRWTVSAEERQQLKAMARDFPRLLARADVATARALLGYWIAAAYVDGHKRSGRLVLRNVPVARLETFATKSEAARGRSRSRPAPPGPPPTRATARRTQPCDRTAAAPRAAALPH